jgi:hypothetical protein
MPGQDRRTAMLQVLNHVTGVTTTYATRTEALAAGRLLARQLATARAFEGILEDPGDDRLLIYGTVQNAAGRIIEAPPLVQVSFARVSRGARRQASHQPP